VLTPEKESFLDNEPIRVRLCLKNNSDSMVTLEFSYPHLIGVTFSCEARGVTRNIVLFADGNDSRATIEPAGLLKKRICLDRYLSFTDKTQYRIEYVAEYWDPKAKRLHRGTGSFQIMLRPDPLESSVSELRQALGESDKERSRELLEPLLYWKDNRIIEVLLEAVQKYPVCSADVALAFAELAESERGREALGELMKTADRRGLRAAFNICEDKGVSIPDAIIQNLLSSKDGMRRHAAQQYHRAELRRHPDRNGASQESGGAVSVLQAAPKSPPEAPRRNPATASGQVSEARRRTDPDSGPTWLHIALGLTGAAALGAVGMWLLLRRRAAWGGTS
jgi:hypothetical protein